MATALIILAAGNGTRMNSDLPKVLHRLGGVPLLAHGLALGREIEAARQIVVTGFGANAVAEAAHQFEPEAEIVFQEQQLGTGHAANQAREALADFDGDVIVLLGDTPFVQPETLREILKMRQAGNEVVVLGFRTETPARYGRLITSDAGHLTAIVEAKDATAEQAAIDLCNSGVICADRRRLFDLIAAIDDKNASGEFYLTDIVAVANAQGATCGVVIAEESETMGIDSRAGLARAEALFQARRREQALANGVTLSAPETVQFAQDTYLGRDVIVGANVVFGPGVTVETGAEIRAFCHLEGCHVSAGAIIGPFARLRPGAEISEDAHIGNFVEIKNAILGPGAKANHLSYIGDADIGAAANIGAGTITCNYDGVLKHRTKIGDRAFIGSNTALVAPVTIGDEAMTGSGAVITKNVPDGALALTRPEQQIKPGFVARYLARLRAKKSSQNKD